MPHQHPTLIGRVPGEIVDAVIDHLASDLKALGACALVCSEWLPRSRYHNFSTVYLCTRRIHSFTNLVCSPSCTFTPYISRIEIDGSSKYSTPNDATTGLTVCNSLALSQQPCSSRVESIRLQNMDWTAFNFQEQATIARRLSRFTAVTRFELHRVVFHDTRAIDRLFRCFPSIQLAFVTQILLTKFFDQAVVAASRLRLSTSLQSIELGNRDEVALFLTCLAAHSSGEAPLVRDLTLNALREEDIGYLNSALHVLGPSLWLLKVTFCEGRATRTLAPDGPERCVDLSSLTCLRSISLDVLDFFASKSESPARSLVKTTDISFVLSTLHSDELEYVELAFRLRSWEVQPDVNWRRLDNALLQPTSRYLGKVRIKLLHPGTLEEKEMDLHIRRSMPVLERRGMLRVTFEVYTEAKSEVTDEFNWAVQYGYDVPKA